MMTIPSSTSQSYYDDYINTKSRQSYSQTPFLSQSNETNNKSETTKQQVSQQEKETLLNQYTKSNNTNVNLAQVQKEKDYTAMTYEELRALSFNEFRQNKEAISQNIKSKTEDEHEEEADMIHAKLEVLDFSKKQNVNKAVFNSLEETPLPPKEFMGMLHLEVTGHLLTLDPQKNANQNTKETLNYKAFFDDTIERYENKLDEHEGYTTIIDAFKLMSNNLNNKV